MNKSNYLKQIIDRFLENPIPYQLIVDYFERGFKLLEVQDYISYNLREEFQWATAIGIIEAGETIYNESVGNGNIKGGEEWTTLK